MHGRLRPIKRTSTAPTGSCEVATNAGLTIGGHLEGAHRAVTVQVKYPDVGRERGDRLEEAALVEVPAGDGAAADQDGLGDVGDQAALSRQRRLRRSKVVVWGPARPGGGGGRHRGRWSGRRTGGTGPPRRRRPRAGAAGGCACPAGGCGGCPASPPGGGRAGQDQPGAAVDAGAGLVRGHVRPWSSSRARRKTRSSISSVSRPVAVFCCHN
jgi:hypothetical protein